MKVLEKDFIVGERIKLQKDIYSLAIASFLSREVSPANQASCIRLAGICFVLELGVMFGFTAEVYKMDQIKPFAILATSLRILCTLLFQEFLFGQLQ